MEKENSDPLFGKSRRVLIIENPKSGQGNSRLDEFKVLLLAQGIGLETRELDRAVEISELVADAEKFDYVIAAGGDGTVCCTAHALVNRNVTMLPYPAGTANLIAQNFGIPKDPAALLNLLLAGKTIEIDIPQLEGKGSSTGFIVAAGAGIDAEMIRESEPLKPTMGVWAYVIGLMKQLNPVISEFKINIDGKNIITRGMSVLVANLGMINFRLPIASGISPADGLLNVLVLKGSSPFSLLPNMLDSFKQKLGLGDPIFKDNLEIYSGREIVIESDTPLPIQYDGELFEGQMPLRVSVLPRAVRFICADYNVST